MNKIGILLFFLFPLIVLGQKFAVIGDYRGGDTNALKVSQLVRSWNPDFVVTTGDNYRPAQGTIDFQVGQFYHEFIFPYVGSYGLGDMVNRFFPAIGNHDVEGTGLIDYLNYFSLPGNERYYDFVKGDCHFFILNSDYTEIDGNTSSSIQGVWLQNLLAASLSKYKLVFLHHPPFSSGAHGSNIYAQWPYKQWGATAVFAGHDHDYERLYIDSFPYFISAAGGAALYTTFNNYPGTQHFYADNFGALLIEANSDSMLLKYYNIKDSLIDSYVIKSPSAGIKPINLKPFDIDNIIQNFPNPFLNSTTIRYYIKTSCNVNLSVFNSTGQKIITLINSKQNKGDYQILWNASDFPAGVYSICLRAGENRYLVKTIRTENK
jgi:hypothetical protein